MTKIDPFKDRDLTVLLKWPALSWSSVNAFEYNPDSWYKQYVLGELGPRNSAMLGGIEVGHRIVADPTYLPTIPRGGIFEQELRGKLGKIQLMGHLDHYWPGEGIDEYKTSANPNRWTQAKVDTHRQFDFYCLLVWLNYKILPEDLRLRLYAIPMREQGSFEMKQIGEPKVFETKRTKQQIILFGAHLASLHRAMQAFVDSKNLLR